VTDAAYVIGGWALTGAVLVAYGERLWARSRRARKMLPDERGGETPWK